MMHLIASEILIIVMLVLANGVFAMAEIAIISCRKPRLRKLAEQGDARAQAALELAEAPNRFLSTVQVGITLVGILAGAFGGATIAREIAKALESFPMVAPYGGAIGIGVVVLGITLLSVVLGELVPKRLALNNPMGVALTLARPVRRLSDLTAPIVRLLGALTDAVLKLFGFQPKAEPVVTEDEVRSLVELGHEAGVIFKAEKEIVEQVLALVPDEFGTVQGLVTLVDVFEEIVGDIPSFDQPRRMRVVRRDDGSWLVDASLELEELKQLLGVKQIPGEENESYETLSGFVLHQMQRVPREGDHFEWGGFRFEIADMDRQRLDKVLIQRLPTTSTKPRN